MATPKLAGCSVVITGASSGIGRATALAFARAGARLVLAARRPGPLGDVVQACEALGAHAIAVPTDVTNPESVTALVAAALGRMGRIDVWVNNVGTGAVGAFTDTPLAAHRRVIETNLLGYVHGAHAVLPHFVQQREGVLINMISVGGWVATPYAAAYSASKFGIRGFSEALRAEVSRWANIHVCDVYPGFVDTPGITHGANYTGKHVRPFPPMLDPRTVADAVVSLAVQPRPTTTVGATAAVLRMGHALAPTLSGHVARWLFDRGLQRARPAPRSDGSLFSANSRNYAIDGGYRGRTKPARRGLPALSVALLGAAALAGASWLAVSRRS